MPNGNYWVFINFCNLKNHNSRWTNPLEKICMLTEKAWCYLNSWAQNMPPINQRVVVHGCGKKSGSIKPGDIYNWEMVSLGAATWCSPGSHWMKWASPMISEHRWITLFVCTLGVKNCTRLPNHTWNSTRSLHCSLQSIHLGNLGNLQQFGTWAWKCMEFGVMSQVTSGIFCTNFVSSWPQWSACKVVCCGTCYTPCPLDHVYHHIFTDDKAFN